MLGLAVDEPRVPLSHDDGTGCPAARSASRIVVPAGTATSTPARASVTVNARSSGRAIAAPSTKLSKWMFAPFQCPVMSRTASISGRGPQQ